MVAVASPFPLAIYPLLPCPSGTPPPTQSQSCSHSRCPGADLRVGAEQVYAAGGGKKRMANYVRGGDGNYAQSSIYVRMDNAHLADEFCSLELLRKCVTRSCFPHYAPPHTHTHTCFFICTHSILHGCHIQSGGCIDLTWSVPSLEVVVGSLTNSSTTLSTNRTAADEWECKEVPEWSRMDPQAATVKLEPHWFKTKFWNNKQEKKNPWFAFRLHSEGAVHVSVPFPVYQYYPHQTDPNSTEYYNKAIKPLLEQGLPEMCSSLDRALSNGHIQPSSAEKKVAKRKVDPPGGRKRIIVHGSAAMHDSDRPRSASPKVAPGSPATRPRSGSGLKPSQQRRRPGSGISIGPLHLLFLLRLPYGFVSNWWSWTSHLLILKGTSGQCKCHARTHEPFSW
jgi:hypothetical protein